MPKFIKYAYERLEEMAMMAMLFLIFIIMAYSVVMRYVFNNSLSWAEEICRYLFVWSAFLSAPLCLRRRSSIKIDMLMTALPLKAQRALIAGGDILMCAFFSYMLHAAWNVVWGVYLSRQTSPAILMPMYAVFSSAFVGFALSLLRLAERLYFLISRPEAGYASHLNAGKGGETA